jgi:flagellar biosynthetic protein FliR
MSDVLLPLLLGAARAGGFLYTLPAMGGPRVPVPATVGLGMFLVLLVPTPRAAIPMELGPFVALLAKELSVGMLLGWGVALAFAAVQICGQIAELVLGLGAGQIVDPVHGIESTVVARLYGTLALLLYLGTDAHHHVLRLLGLSFATLPVDRLVPVGELSRWGVGMVAAAFLTGIQLAGPLLAASVALEAGLALSARAAPQANTFLVALPLKVGLGLVFVGLFLPHLLSGINHALAHAVREGVLLLRRVP